MKTGALVLGYHGCDRAVGEKLVRADQRFRSSKNDYDWLGDGIYFWEGNPQRAQDWARFMAGHPKFKKRVKAPFAVGAVVELGNCLDLTEAGSLSLVRTAYEELAESFRYSETALPKNKSAHSEDEDLVERHLDCAVINFLHDLREEQGSEAFDTVRGAFFEGKKLYPGARIQSKTHIQLCVRNPAMIRGVFHITVN